MAAYKNKSGLPTTENIQIARLAGLAQLGSDYGSKFLDFVGNNNPPADTVVTVGGSASIVPATGATTRGGVIISATGATAGSPALIETKIASVGPMATDKWAFAWRGNFPILPTANSRQIAGFIDVGNTASILIGALGPVNASNYIVQYNGVFTGSSINLGVAFDTLVNHTWTMWHPGDGKLYASMDGGATLGGVTLSGPPPEGRLWCQDYNNGAAQSLSRAIDWICWVYPRN